jgi:hypothetical protein
VTMNESADGIMMLQWVLVVLDSEAAYFFRVHGSGRVHCFEKRRLVTQMLTITAGPNTSKPA